MLKFLQKLFWLQHGRDFFTNLPGHPGHTNKQLGIVGFGTDVTYDFVNTFPK
jgi:hypothetical protein